MIAVAFRLSASKRKRQRRHYWSERSGILSKEKKFREKRAKCWRRKMERMTWVGEEASVGGGGAEDGRES